MPRAVQRATAADVPYSMSSGCATTQSTRWKDSSGRAGNVMSAILACFMASAPPNADLGAPLLDDVDSALGGDLVGPVPQAQVELRRGAGEHPVGPSGVAGGGDDRPVADPHRPAVTRVGGADQHGVRLGRV